MRSEAGLEVAFDWNVSSIGLRPHARAAWLHEFSDNSRPIGASFGGASYAVSSRGAQRDSALLSAGLDLVINPHALVYADYSVQTGSVTRILSDWRIGVMVKF